jgi:hypothetical protein
VLFLLFGGGTRLRERGPGAVRECPNCHNTTRWTRVKRVDELTFFFVPVLRWGRQELEACPICHAAVPAPEAERHGLLRRRPAPASA